MLVFERVGTFPASSVHSVCTDNRKFYPSPTARAGHTRTHALTIFSPSCCCVHKSRRRRKGLRRKFLHPSFLSLSLDLRRKEIAVARFSCPKICRHLFSHISKRRFRMEIIRYARKKNRGISQASLGLECPRVWCVRSALILDRDGHLHSNMLLVFLPHRTSERTKVAALL